MRGFSPKSSSRAYPLVRTEDGLAYSIVPAGSVTRIDSLAWSIALEKGLILEGLDEAFVVAQALYTKAEFFREIL